MKIDEYRSISENVQVSDIVLAGYQNAIEQIKNSDFLQGKHSGRPWQITFDWLILPNNYPKVLEGNYKTALNKNGRSSLEDIDIGESNT